MNLPKYRDRISLIPNGCPQILDFACSESQFSRMRRSFEERSEKDASGIPSLRLFPLEEKDGVLLDVFEHKAPQGEVYSRDLLKTIRPWLGHWIPVPFLREREQVWKDTGERLVDKGPSNWARCLIVRNDEVADSFRIVLAFDMQVEGSQSDIVARELDQKDGVGQSAQNTVYAALSQRDVDAHAQFRLAWKVRDNGWFLNEVWVDEWLREIWMYQPKRNREEGIELEHLASYLMVLEFLDRVIEDARVYVINPSKLLPVDVDFVLDIGNSRTTGILVETRAQSVTNLNDSYLLQLRDMDQPWHIYKEPFETRVEFSEVKFGIEAFSRRSGRRTGAFIWPSPVRIGPEAARLSSQSRCAEGATGMSSPKRYLWDERDWLQSWRFNTKGQGEPYVTRGLLAQQVNSSGTPLCCMNDPLFKNNKILRRQETDCAFESHFTRSSLMMFLLVEVIQQALLTINSPGQRLRRESPDVPRRLRQVIFTVPAGMPLAEQHIYRRWAHWAVRVLWETLGWKEFYGGKREQGRIAQNEYRKSPEVRCNWDEATCTQLVYIYNEISRKFQGDALEFCLLKGRRREEYGNHPCLRVATIDIGGGTTDLSITTFELQSDAGQTARLAPHPEFHDGFSLAGDDVLCAIIRDHVLYDIGEAMGQAGILDVRGALAHLFGRDVIDSSQESRNARIQCVRQIAVPIALSILGIYEQCDLKSGVAPVLCSLGDCFHESMASDAESAKTGNREDKSFPVKRFPRPSEAAIQYVEEYVKKNGKNSDFSLLEVPLKIDLRRVDDTVRGCLKEILENLSEVIYRYDCDALLLTGRPSCWQGIIDKVVSMVPVPPDRIFPMGKYRVGSWYPFANALGKVTDPKTTVVVGAILCTLAEGQLEGFSFDPSNLRLSSTARYIGEMELTGQLKHAKVWFNVDVSRMEEASYQKEILFGAPISVGFRQLDVERWTTTRFYVLEFASEEQRHKYAAGLPFTVSLELRVPGKEEIDDLYAHTDEERDEGEFTIVDIVDAQGNAIPNALSMRLQTLPRDEGFWLDTGIVMG